MKRQRTFRTLFAEARKSPAYAAEMARLAEEDAMPATTGKRSEAQIIKDLQDNECQLSPENISCDGELHPLVVAQRRRTLLAKRTQLVKELGRIPTPADIYPEG